MLLTYIDNEVREGTNFRQVILYEDDNDVIMTTEIMYEDEFEDDVEDEEYDYDGPLDDDDPDL